MPRTLMIQVTIDDLTDSKGEVDTERTNKRITKIADGIAKIISSAGARELAVSVDGTKCI